MSHPIPNTSDSHSVQIILPQGQLGRKHDMYIFCCSYEHHVVPKGKYIAFVSTTVETSTPEVELQPGGWCTMGLVHGLVVHWLQSK